MERRFEKNLRVLGLATLGLLWVGAAQAGITFTAGSSSINSGDCAPYQVANVHNNGVIRPLRSGRDGQITLSGAGTGGAFYKDSTCSQSLSSSDMYLASGETYKSFFYKKTSAGSVSLKAAMGSTADGSYCDATKAVVVNSGPIIIVSPSPSPSPTVTATPTPAPIVTATPTPTPIVGVGCSFNANKMEKGMWIWNYSPSVVTDSAARAGLFTFALNKNVRLLYLDAAAYLSGSTNLAGLRTFLDMASTNCMRVDLLFGSSSWALTANHSQMVSKVTSVVSFLSTLSASQRAALRGIHMDVEPYTLAEWSTDMNGTANQYIDLLDKVNVAAAGSGLEISADIPFWWDSKNVTRAGVTRPLHQWVIDRLDRAVLMDYRDTGSEMISLGLTEVQYASAHGKKVNLGAETICGLIPETLSFCEEGENAMESALDQVISNLSGQSGFDGVSVHHYNQYKSLWP